jgi:hypothetical protein
VFSSNIRQG